MKWKKSWKFLKAGLYVAKRKDFDAKIIKDTTDFKWYWYVDGEYGYFSGISIKLRSAKIAATRAMNKLLTTQ